MTGEEVRKMTAEEMGLELKKLQDKLYTIRAQHVTEKVEDTSVYGKVKKDIARIKTEMTVRAKAGAK